MPRTKSWGYYRPPGFHRPAWWPTSLEANMKMCVKCQRINPLDTLVCIGMDCPSREFKNIDFQEEETSEDRICCEPTANTIGNSA